jgi:hypothetical protein
MTLLYGNYLNQNIKNFKSKFGYLKYCSYINNVKLNNEYEYEFRLSKRSRIVLQ